VFSALLKTLGVDFKLNSNSFVLMASCTRQFVALAHQHRVQHFTSIKSNHGPKMDLGRLYSYLLRILGNWYDYLCGFEICFLFVCKNATTTACTHANWDSGVGVGNWWDKLI
jgi:hypothetical protein